MWSSKQNLKNGLALYSFQVNGNNSFIGAYCKQHWSLCNFVLAIPTFRDKEIHFLSGTYYHTQEKHKYALFLLPRGGQRWMLLSNYFYFLLALLLLPSRDEYYLIFFFYFGLTKSCPKMKPRPRADKYFIWKRKINIHHTDVCFCWKC